MIEQFLQILREHPDGITTPEITKILFADKWKYNCWTTKTYAIGHRLEKQGIVTREIRPGRGRNRVAVWRLAQ